MADRWLNRLNAVENIIFNNRNSTRCTWNHQYILTKSLTTSVCILRHGIPSNTLTHTTTNYTVRRLKHIIISFESLSLQLYSPHTCCHQYRWNYHIFCWFAASILFNCYNVRNRKIYLFNFAKDSFRTNVVVWVAINWKTNCFADFIACQRTRSIAG
jgi:hypothetical protein